MNGFVKFSTFAIVGTAAGLATKLALKMAKPSPLLNGFTYTAHTGCEGTPDNTLVSLKKGISLGVPVFEVDVTFRDDGTPVLLHSASAGVDKGVLFEDAVQYVSENADGLMLNLDLKAFWNIPEIVNILEKYNMKERCFFTGVTSQNTQKVKVDGAGIPYYLNASLNRARLFNGPYLNSVICEIKRSGAVGLNSHFTNASEELVDALHKNGLKASFWTANDKLTMKYLISLGVDNITTRFPSVIKTLV